MDKNMTETYIDQDSFPADTLDADIEREGELNIEAGAIRYWIEEKNNAKILFTEWEQN
jgi:hypothetical protein